MVTSLIQSVHTQLKRATLLSCAGRVVRFLLIGIVVLVLWDTFLTWRSLLEPSTWEVASATSEQRVSAPLLEVFTKAFGEGDGDWTVLGSGTLLDGAHNGLHAGDSSQAVVRNMSAVESHQEVGRQPQLPLFRAAEALRAISGHSTESGRDTGSLSFSQHGALPNKGPAESDRKSGPIVEHLLPLPSNAKVLSTRLTRTGLPNGELVCIPHISAQTLVLSWRRLGWTVSVSSVARDPLCYAVCTRNGVTITSLIASPTDAEEASERGHGGEIVVLSTRH
jgi:hypothetical protein